MKKILKIAFRIVAILLLMVVLIIGYFLVFQQSLVRTVWIALTESSENIEQNIENEKQQLKQEINNAGYSITDEQLEMLGKGELDEDQITQILLGNTDVQKHPEGEGDDDPDGPTGTEQAPVPDDELENGEDVGHTDVPDESGKTDADNNPQQGKPSKEPGKADGKQPSKPVKDDTGKKPGKNDGAQTQPAKPGKNDSTDKQPSQSQDGNAATANPATDERVARLIARMYVLKSQYVSSIDGLIAQMKADYLKIPPEERSTSVKADIATNYLSQITALETQCDAQVDAIVTELRGVLTEIGADQTLADAIRQAYANEKENTKSYYISVYGD